MRNMFLFSLASAMMIIIGSLFVYVVYHINETKRYDKLNDVLFTANKKMHFMISYHMYINIL